MNNGIYVLLNEILVLNKIYTFREKFNNTVSKRVHKSVKYTFQNDMELSDNTINLCYSSSAM